MSDSLYLRVPDATDIDEGFGAFKASLDEQIDQVAGAIDSLVSLESFQGQAAESIKAYYQQVHQTLLYLLRLLVAELDTVYNFSYYRNVLDVASDSSGEFPSWDMWDKARDFDRFANEDTPPIDRLLREAHAAAPAGYSFDTPSTSAFTIAMRNEARIIDKTREGLQKAESTGVSALRRSDGSYQHLYMALSRAISRCARGTVSQSKYRSGEFRNATSDLGLQELAVEIQADQDAKASVVLATKLEGADNRKLDIERARQKAAEQKAWWAVGGEVLQVVILGAAVAGLCVATGGVAIAFSAVAVASASYGVYQRGKQLSDMGKDAGADIDKGDALSKGLKAAKEGKDAGKGADKVMRAAGLYNRIGAGGFSEQGVAHYQSGALRNAGNATSKATVAVATSAIENYVDEEFGDNLKGRDKLVYDEAKKLTSKGVEKVSDQIIDKALPKMKLGETLSRSVNGRSIVDRVTNDAVKTGTQQAIGKAAGTVGFVAGCAQVYTDYQVKQYDEQIEQCDTAARGVADYKNSLTGGSSRQWAVQW